MSWLSMIETMNFVVIFLLHFVLLLLPLPLL